MKRTFYSGRSLFLGIAFNGFIVAMIYIITKLVIESKGLFLIPIIVLGLLLVGWLWYMPLKYIVENGVFYIVYGRKQSKKIPIRSIISIKKSKTPVASAARGIKRIEIATSEGDWIIISPKEREAFINLIKEINPLIRT